MTKRNVSARYFRQLGAAATCLGPFRAGRISFFREKLCLGLLRRFAPFSNPSKSLELEDATWTWDWETFLMKRYKFYAPKQKTFNNYGHRWMVYGFCRKGQGDCAPFCTNFSVHSTNGSLKFRCATLCHFFFVSGHQNNYFCFICHSRLTAPCVKHLIWFTTFSPLHFWFWKLCKNILLTNLSTRFCCIRVLVFPWIENSRPQKYTDFFKFPLACLETVLKFKNETKLLLTCRCFRYSRTGPKNAVENKQERFLSPVLAGKQISNGTEPKKKLK